MALASSTPAEIPRLRSGIDLTRAGLSHEEGFLVSRVDGHTSVRDIAVLVGKSVEDTQKVVDRLTTAGVLVVGDDGEEVTGDPYDEYLFPADALAEGVDLSEDEKRRILFTHGCLGTWTHYRLLGVRWRDDAKTIKKAYFERSKEWHPDRYRRANLGSYKARIDEIFRAITEAHRVLSNPKAKAKYDEDHAPSLDEEDMAELLAAQRREERTEEREARKKRLRLEKNPLRQRMLRAKGHYEEALKKKEAGEMMDALHMAQAAVALHDRDEYKALKQELQRATADLRIAPLIRRGVHLESMTSWNEAIVVFTEAVRLAPDHGQARLRLAYNLVMGGRPPQMISEHVQRAIQLLPDEPEAHFVRGLCYERGEMDKAAISAYQRAIELKPNYTEAKKRLKKLRWGF